jgi:hypothetical protein
MLALFSTIHHYVQFQNFCAELPPPDRLALVMFFADNQYIWDIYNKKIYYEMTVTLKDQQ